MTRRIVLMMTAVFLMTNLVIAAQKTPSQMRTETTLGYTANGVGAITGPKAGATFTDIIDSYIPFLHSSSNCFWRANGISTPASCEPVVNENVTNNAALKALSISGKTAGYTVFRQGFSTPGDGGNLFYAFSSSACSVSGGNDFTQVAPTTGTGCWNAYQSAKGIDIRATGMLAGDLIENSSPNAAIMAKIFADTTNTLKIVVPAGVFRLPCSLAVSAAGSLEFEFQTGAIWRFDPSCTFSPNVFAFTGAKAFKMTGDGTIDLNNPVVAPTLRVIFICTAYTASKDYCIMSGMKIINGADRLAYFAGGAQGGFTLSNFVAQNNYIQGTPGNLQNQCILLTTLAGSGTIARPVVQNNTCNGSGLQIAGTSPQVTFNDVSNFEFGNAVFVEPGTTNLVTSDCYIANNYFHNTGTGRDVNGSVHSGMEDNCENSVVLSNYFSNLGGRGITVFTPKGYYANNVFKGIGEGFDATTSNRAAIALALGSTPGTQAAKEVTIVGNIIQDSGVTAGGSPAMLFGIFMGPGITGEVRGNGNVVNINSAVDGTGKFIAAAFSPIATATAAPDLIESQSLKSSLTSSVANMTFAPLDTVSFGQFKLSCRRINMASADTLQVQVSQDGGSSWKTAGTYVSSGQDDNNGTLTGYVSTTATGIQIGNTTMDASNTVNGSFELICSNLENTVSRKTCRFSGTGRNSGTLASLQTTGRGYWNGDANPINGLRVLSIGGANFTGACALRGTLN